MNNALLVLFTLFYTFACVSLGCFFITLINRKRPFRDSAAVLLATAFILGIGVISSIWMVIALFGWFRLSIIIPVLVLSAASGVVFLKPFVQGTLRQLKAVWQETRSDTWGWQWAAAVTSILFVLGIFSMATWAGDAIAFYMASPKVIASANRLTPLPAYEGFMSVGMLGEMHMAAFHKLNLQVGFKFFTGFLSAATAILLLGISSKAGLKTRGKWLVLAAYVTSSAVYLILGNGKTDLIAAALGIAAYYFAFSGGPLSLIGLFCGFSGTMKLSYLVTVFPGIAVLMLWHQWKSLDGQKLTFSNILRLAAPLAQKGLVIGLWVLIAALPHFLKNGILLNAPLAPIGLSSIGWLEQDFFGPETTRRVVMTYPFALTFGNYWGQDGTLSPLLLAFAPFAIFLPRPKKWTDSPLLALFLAGLVGMGIWLLRFPSVLAPRYYLATLLIFLPPALRGIEAVSYREDRFRWPKFFALLCTMIILAAVGIKSVEHYRPAMLPKLLQGATDACDWDATGGGGFCDVQTSINEVAKPGERVYLASYYRYFLRPELLQCTNGEDDVIDSSSSETLWTGLYRRGFKYLMIDGSRPEFNPIENPPPSWVRVYPLSLPGNPSSYEIQYDAVPDGSVPEVSCQPVDNQGVWGLVEEDR